jgi:hypothetical protein
MIHRKVVPFDEFYYQLKLMHLFLLHPVYFFQENLVVILATICRQKSPKIVGTFLSENISKNKNEECARNVRRFFVQKIYQVSARNAPVRLFWYLCLVLQNLKLNNVFRFKNLNILINLILKQGISNTYF